MDNFSIKITFVFLFTAIAACGHAERRHANGAEASSEKIEIPAERKITLLQLDSLAIESFITLNSVNETRAGQLRRFYQSRDYQYAWFYEHGLAQQAQAFWNMH